MTNPLGVTPVQGSTTWYTDYDNIHAAVAALFGIVNGLAPAAGPVVSVNLLTPDITGNVTLGPTDVGATPAGYAPSFGDILNCSTITVDKDPLTGFWPSGWDPAGNPIYLLGAVDQGVRPTANPLVVVRWRGVDPSPASVTTGTGGMLRGKDERILPG